VTEVKESSKHASARAAADHLCVSPVTFSKYLNQGIIKRQPRHIGYDLDECRRARFKFLENQAAGRSGADGGELLAKERALLAREQREAATIKNELARGELIHLGVIERVLGEMFSIEREIALGMPGKVADAVAAACGLDRALCYSILDREVREMLELMSAPDVLAKATGKPQPRRQRRVDVEEVAA
jgi:hypothetical protein